MMNSGTKAPTAYKKFIPLLALALTITGSMGARAQVRLGVIGGLHSANIQEKNNLPGWDTTTKKFLSSLSGFQLGFILEVPLGHKGFFFQPAIAYTSKGRKYDKNYDTTASVPGDTIYNR